MALFVDFLSKLGQSQNVPQPVGNTYRGLGADWFNAGNVAAEDWQREQQAAELAWSRDKKMLELSNAFTAEQNRLDRDFNASEAQKNRVQQDLWRKTAYQDAVADMKAAGLNPVLAFSNGGADLPSGSSASSNSSGSAHAVRSGSSKGYGKGTADTSGFVNMLGDVAKVMAGMYSSTLSTLANYAARTAPTSTFVFRGKNRSFSKTFRK